jgi:mono/diheme cytochrome c family protein
MKKYIAHLPLVISAYFLLGVSKCDSPELERSGTPPINYTLEEKRRNSSLDFPTPEVHQILRNGKAIWQLGDTAPTLYAGETLELVGSGLGAGTNIDYSKILIGRARVLESDLKMYVGNVDVIKADYFEENKTYDTWDREILQWSNEHIKFKVPETTDRGPLVVSVQKRIDSNKSLTIADRAHSVWDPNSERVRGPFNHKSDVVSKLSEAKLSSPIDVIVVNKNFKDRVLAGEKIYWSYDYNIGAVHNARNQDWTSIMQGKSIDPITGEKADPEKLFGAIPIKSNLIVPNFLREKVTFDPYPIPNPLTSVVSGKQLYSGETNPTGYVGYVYASSLEPKTGKEGHWIGFSCASCHGQQISFPDKNGKSVTKVFAGLPNPNWSMKFLVLSKFKEVQGKEEGINGEIDKTMLLYHVPNGAGEHSLLRSSTVKSSPYRNDFLFSPIAIPNVTTHTPLRRSLSHTELYAGFEGSYVHSEEPDGAIGSMNSDSLKSLTAYMTTLNKDDQVLHQLAMHRWLKQNNLLNEIDNNSEKEFIYNDKKSYPILASRLERGKALYAQHCLKCHSSNFGTGSDENMIPITEVGTYFSPTIFQRETQSIRSSMMTHLYWVQKRGLLHDTHVKSLEDLVNPDRCDTKSTLYKKYYTIHSGSFKIPVGTPEQEKITEKHAYFSRVDWDSKNFYWDYQKMLKEFGPKEFGTNQVLNLPKTPHPWCLKDKSEIKDLVSYLLTL